MELANHCYTIAALTLFRKYVVSAEAEFRECRYLYRRVKVKALNLKIPNNLRCFKSLMRRYSHSSTLRAGSQPAR